MHFSSFGIGVAITVLTVVVAGLSLRNTMRKNRAGGDGGPTVAGTPVKRQRTTALVLLAGWAWLGFGVYIVVTSLLGPGGGAAIILGLPVLAATLLAPAAHLLRRLRSIDHDQDLDLRRVDLCLLAVTNRDVSASTIHLFLSVVWVI